MTFAYMASVDLADARNNLTTIQLATSGKTTISVTLLTVDSAVPSSETLQRTTVFNHAARGLGFTVGEDRAAGDWMSLTHANVSLGGVVQNSLRTAATTHSWGAAADDIVISINTTTLRYDVEYSATFTVTFGSLETALLFGFSSTSLSGSASYTSTVVPWGIIVPVLSAVSSPTTNYEAEAIASQAVSASGAVAGLSRSTAPIFRDWTQQYESKEKTLRLSASTAHPFTHQELFEASRTSLPFVVSDGFGDDEHQNEVFFLRGDGSSWKCERATDSNDAQFHVQYKTVVAGYIPDVDV